MAKKRTNEIDVIDIIQRIKIVKDAHIFWLELLNRGDKCILCGADEDKVYLKRTFPEYKGVMFQCRYCNGKFGVKTGTLLSGSNITMVQWTMALFLFLFLSLRSGVSACFLARYLGVSEVSALSMLNNLIEGCKDEGKKLSGVVELDEIIVHDNIDGIGKKSTWAVTDKEYRDIKNAKKKTGWVKKVYKHSKAKVARERRAHDIDLLLKEFRYLKNYGNKFNIPFYLEYADKVLFS